MQLEWLTEHQKWLEKEFWVTHKLNKEWKMYLETNTKYDTYLNKKRKKEQIDKLASLTDQLNLLAKTLDVVVGRVENLDPTLSEEPTIIKAREVLTWIQTILAK